jgi:peptidoglycan/LPS O-acetylase OafA/YrhL
VANHAAPATGDRRYAALDGLRGVAVMLVFFVHAAGNTAAVTFNVNFDRLQRADIATAYEGVLYWLFESHHGVYLFFVLSGFLIGRMWWPRPVLRYGTFAWRRTLRIYPAFLLAFLASLAMAFYSGTWQPPDVARVLANLLFLNGAPGASVAVFNVVTWSLFYEMTFYLVFPAIALFVLGRGPRFGPWLWLAGFVSPVIAAALGADPLVLCWSLLFLGVALAVHEATLRAWAARVPGVAILAFYFAVTTLAFGGALPAILAILAFGCATLAVIAKALLADNLVASLLSLRALRALGRISYSFYLVHWMAVVLIARVAYDHRDALGPASAALVIFGGGFVVSAALASLLWWVAERPYLAWVRDPRSRLRV